MEEQKQIKQNQSDGEKPIYLTDEQKERIAKVICDYFNKKKEGE